jgi:beta-glucosidase
MNLFWFPKDFIWGAATAAYQIEGATQADGRGESTWDAFCRRPGKILENHDAATACDHYHRFRQDVALMQTLGLKAYRFSIAWPRIFPDGEGPPNARGLDFYKALCEALLDAGITPFATLFHWDLPLALETKYGGWRSRETPLRFADYAGHVARALDGYAQDFMTVNETFCFTALAHRPDFNAMHAPGRIEDRRTVNQITHHALLAHGLALAAIRAARPQARVGVAEVGNYFVPVYDTEAHIRAARTAFRRENLQILFPHFENGYAPDFLEAQGPDAPAFTEADMRAIAAPMDFVGLNYYRAAVVRHADTEQGYEIIAPPADIPRTHMGWEITPKGIYYLVKHAADYFGNLPIYITENGMSARDAETTAGEVLDTDRLEYYRQHLIMLSAALQEGLPLKGYFAWSLMDNFEWSLGYTQRFGLTRVNYTTQQRTLKLSGHYYREVIRANRVL